MQFFDSWRLATVLLICHFISACGFAIDSAVTISGEVPRSDQPFLNDPEEFQFVVVGDRTGGHRPGIFSHAMTQINLLRPEFVVCVGDLIEGYTDNADEINRQWQHIEKTIGTLEMPFFYTVGNHDISNPIMAEIWRQRLGSEYYSFIYRDVLFISLSTEDPAVEMSEAVIESQNRLEKMMQDQPLQTQEKLLQMARQRSSVTLPGQVAISSNQVDFVQRTLQKNAEVRWTILLMHKPAWQYDSPEFTKIETMLQDRNYSVIAGHEHYYSYTKRYGQDYIDMGTTGGVWLKDGPGRSDHITWVTMTRKGPVFANIKLDGVFDKHAINKPE